MSSSPPVKGMMHEGTNVVIMKHDRTGKSPGKLVDFLMKDTIVTNVIDHLIIPLALLGKGRHRVTIKLVLELGCRFFPVVIQVDVEIRTKRLHKPITVIGNAASLRRERGQPRQSIQTPLENLF